MKKTPFWSEQRSKLRLNIRLYRVTFSFRMIIQCYGFSGYLNLNFEFGKREKHWRTYFRNTFYFSINYATSSVDILPQFMICN